MCGFEGIEGCCSTVQYGPGRRPTFLHGATTTSSHPGSIPEEQGLTRCTCRERLRLPQSRQQDNQGVAEANAWRRRRGLPALGGPACPTSSRRSRGQPQAVFNTGTVTATSPCQGVKARATPRKDQTVSGRWPGRGGRLGSQHRGPLVAWNYYSDDNERTRVREASREVRRGRVTPIRSKKVQLVYIWAAADEKPSPRRRQGQGKRPRVELENRGAGHRRRRNKTCRRRPHGKINPR